MPTLSVTSGEQWLQFFSLGKETTEGTPVSVTRKLYGTGSLTKTRAINMIKVSSGTRDNVRDAKVRATAAAGSFEQPLSADEIVELLLGCVRGGVTPTGSASAGYYWNFTPSSVTPPVDPTTWEWFDGRRVWQGRGYKIDTLKIDGQPMADTKVTATLFGRDIVNNGTTSSWSGAERSTDFIEGWEARLYIDGIGQTPGTTIVPGTMVNYSLSIGNGFGRKYFADNTTATGAITTGELALTAEMTLEANAFAIAEFVQREATPTGRRLIRFELGNNANIGGATAYGPPTGVTPSTATSGGTLAAGTYFYRVTATFTNQNESAPSTEVSQVTTGATSTVTLTWTAPTGLPGGISITGYNIYGRVQGFETFLATVTAGTLTYTDTGAATPTGQLLPPTTAAPRKIVRFDIPGVYSAIDLTPMDAGTKVYKFSVQYLYDSTNGYGLQVGVQNGRSTSYSAT